jgi:predicted DNA-binding ribbon-helix-helix protein
LAKHSVVISGHRTSVSVEDAFWAELRAIAARRGVSLNRLIGDVDRARQGSLSSAIRLFVLDELRRERDRMRPKV